ncbi:siderophore-iron reductase FhuF [Caballeronia insecticola]|uniref:Putative iron transport-related membrane protein n=1 Tax=Caballeronia insecticola TaxID=758793 RepID=R4X362_9BURK|nr:siderophore-iron reductase FhuF [Caballeronia insecticola]BAN27156.1 putative iron transport-related membrane protein [Caballeronia insecticola]
MKPEARSFAAFAPPALAPYLQHVWLGEPAHAPGDNAMRIPLSALPDHRAALLDAMTALYGGDAAHHARALLSQWSKYYFGLAAPAGVAAARLLGRPLDMSPERTHLVLMNGMPAELHFDADALQPADADPARRYAGLIAHLDSVIAMLSGMTKIAPRVLWSNAGNLLDYLLANCPLQCPTMSNDADIDAAWLFRASDANPLRTPLRDATPRSPLLPNPFRARRVCCVRYEIPGETQLCASCPLLLTMRDEELALQDAIR